MESVIANSRRGVLRCATAGSVDDGKSTLIGRLLLDCKALQADQLEHIEQASQRRGFARTELALLTDGLRAEREQGITIDVAWRYFATANRRFILADTPGHAQYTRNMVTGASQAELAIVLADAERGPTEQTRRHLAVSALLRVPAVVVAVNKLDRVGWQQQRFDVIADEIRQAVAKLPWPLALTFIPISALLGDNVASRSTSLDWYHGPTLLEYLEQLEPPQTPTPGGVLPVQWVIRPQDERYATYRGLAGRLAAGQLQVGQQIVVYPSEQQSRIAAISGPSGDLQPQAAAGESVVVKLCDDVDVGRGDILATLDAGLRPSRRLTAEVCWLARAPLRPGARLWLQHHSRKVRARCTGVGERLDLLTGQRSAIAELGQNELGSVELELAQPLPLRRYIEDRALGRCLLIDEASGETVAAALLRELLD